MRKRIVIAVVVLVVGVLGLVLKPREKSVEQLKRNYVEACTEVPLADYVRFRWTQITRREESWQSSYERKRKRIDNHEKRLIKAGHLEERTFIMSNHPFRTVVWDNARNALSSNSPTRSSVLSFLYTNDFLLFRTFAYDEVVARIRTVGSNQCVVVAPHENMPNLEELVRKADVP